MDSCVESVLLCCINQRLASFIGRERTSLNAIEFGFEIPVELAIIKSSILTYHKSLHLYTPHIIIDPKDKEFAGIPCSPATINGQISLIYAIIIELSLASHTKGEMPHERDQTVAAG